MVKILGISCFYHDSAAALIRDGHIIAAAEEERFSRKKHDNSFPRYAIEFCLEEGGIKNEELDYVVFYEKPFLKFERVLLGTLATFPFSWKVFTEAMIAWMKDKLWIKELIKNSLSVDLEKILFVEHHIAHAAAAYYCSPYDKAAILTIDGVGEWVTTTIGVGRGNKIILTDEIRYPHSLGLLYTAFTAFLGFEINEGEYKVMGMAPYGTPRYKDKIYKLINVNYDGSFSLDMQYFSFHYSSEKTYNKKFVKLFGEPRNPHECEKIDLYYADIAASIQEVTEEILLKMSKHVQRVTGLSKLCLAGGVALNSKANYRLLKETPFDELYIQPAAGDAGGAIGAALYVYHLMGKKRSFPLENIYLGKSYLEDDIRLVLKNKNFSFQYFKKIDELLEYVAEKIANGLIVGWYQGRFEWGPRALGNRCILADPRRPEMKDIINNKIKFRESFRPFAPSVLAERANEYFELQDAEKHYPTRFMLYVLPVRVDKRNVIPAVTHIDGSARVQLVFKKDNRIYYSLIENFYKKTGVSVLLNTSFNLKGEPIVNSPEDAINTFAKSGMDILVLDRFIVEK